MMVQIPGFPAAVSESIELPDIGELLLYPQFQGVTADTYRACGTEFQRYLLDRVPLVNDKKHVLVRSGVSLLRPGKRSHVNGEGGWHIDGLGDDDQIIPRERVYILSSSCKALTQFNVSPLTIQCERGETRLQLTARIRRDPAAYGVVGQSIEPCRLYMFDRHLHRAVDPVRIEFRYFLRVRETDAEPFGTAAPLHTIRLWDVQTGENAPHIRYTDEGVTVYYPTDWKHWPRCIPDAESRGGALGSIRQVRM